MLVFQIVFNDLTDVEALARVAPLSVNPLSFFDRVWLWTFPNWHAPLKLVANLRFGPVEAALVANRNSTRALVHLKMPLDFLTADSTFFIYTG